MAALLISYAIIETPKANGFLCFSLQSRDKPFQRDLCSFIARKSDLLFRPLTEEEKNRQRSLEAIDGDLAPFHSSIQVHFLFNLQEMNFMVYHNIRRSRSMQYMYLLEMFYRL